MLCDTEALGLSAYFSILAQPSEHDVTWQQQFLDAVRELPEVMEASQLAGEFYYLLKVCVADAKDCDNFYQGLIAEVTVFKVSALLFMEEIKCCTELALT